MTHSWPSNASFSDGSSREATPADTGAALEALTVLIPFKWSLSRLDLIVRLALNVIRLHRVGIRRVLVGDGTALNVPVRMLCHLLRVEHRPVRCPSFYSPSTVKNCASAGLTSGYVLFLDVDVLLTTTALQWIRAAIESGQRFTWLPVVFLDRQSGTGRMLRDVWSTGVPDREHRIQIGYTTGIQLVELGLFRKLGGYREEFLGYGCEDIEFIHRATGVLGERPPFSENAEYYRDVRSYDVHQLGGFRKHNYNAQRHVPMHAMPLHYWHKRRNKSPYMLERKLNDCLLIELMTAFDVERSEISPKDARCAHLSELAKDQVQ